MNILVLIKHSYFSDSRAMRISQTLAKEYKVEIIEVGEYYKLYNQGNITITTLPKPKANKYARVINHSLYYREYDFIFDYINSLEKTYEVIYCHDLPTLRTGLRLKKKFKAKLVYDAHEIYNETINQFFTRNNSFWKKFKFKFLIGLMRSFGNIFEKRAIREVDLAFSVTQSCCEYLTKKLRFNFVLLPNFPSSVASKKEPKLLRSTLNLNPNKFIVLYQGVLNEGRYLREIVSSSKFFNPDICLVIIGEGQLKEDLQKLSNPNVFFLPLINYENLFQYTGDADLGVMLNEPINLSKHFALANKVIEYANCGVPSLLSNSPEHISLNKTFNLSYIIDDINAKSIADIINTLSNDKVTLKQKAHNALAASISELNWEKHQTTLLSKMRELK